MSRLWSGARTDPDAMRLLAWSIRQGGGTRQTAIREALARRAGAVRYSHDERLQRLSNHSPLILDVPG